MTSGKLFSETEIRKIVESKGYVYISRYIGKWNKTRVLISDKNRYKYDICLSDISKGKKISFINKRNPFTLENISKWCKLNKKTFELLENNVYSGALDKLAFKCKNPKCNETFYSNWNSVYNGYGCRYCSGKQVGSKNNLAYLRPDLVQEWNFELNTISPEKVTISSGKRIYWICTNCNYGKEEEWIARISDRTRGGSCPACAGKVVTNKNRLSITHPEIAFEWHPTKNKNQTPNDVSYGSDKKAWWLCPNGHSYFSSIGSRTRGSACGVCSELKKESFIATELKSYILKKYNAKSEYKIFKNPETNYFLPYDIYIFKGEKLEINGIYIEIHGKQHYKIHDWHRFQSEINGTTPEEEFKYQKKKDGLKKKFAKMNGTYVEIDLRKVKTITEAIDCLEKTITQNS